MWVGSSFVMDGAPGFSFFVSYSVVWLEAAQAFQGNRDLFRIETRCLLITSSVIVAATRPTRAFSGSVCVTQVSPVILPVAPFVNMVCDPHIDRRAAKPPTYQGRTEYIIHPY